ncbi:MAG: MFS transporter [Spirochaetes bacterium]|nr:MFS transporter [Spirochaetota bacterium]
MLAVGLGVFMGAIDMSIINISLPTMMVELNTRFSTVQWVVIGYVLIITCTMMGAARLGDMYEKKKLEIWGLSIFTAGSLLCGFAPNVTWLIAFRVFQGLGAVLMQALGMAIIVEVFPSSERGRALGLLGSIVSVGISLGPPIGGMIIGAMGWEWIFLIKVPLGIVAVLAAIKFLPSLPPGKTGQKFDISGALIFFIALGCFALSMTFAQNYGFTNIIVILLMLFAIIFVLIFLTAEKKISQPMIDMSLFRNITFTVHLIMGFFSFITLAGVFLLPFFLQFVKKYSTQYIGLLMMVTPITIGLVSYLSGILSDRFGSHKLSVLGLILLSAGCFTISTLNEGSGAVGYIMRALPLALGLGMFQSPNNSAIMGAVPRERLGVASGLLSLTRSLGQTAGMPILGAVFASALLAAAPEASLSNIAEAAPRALVSGLSATYKISAVFLFSATILTVIVLSGINKRKAQLQV